MLEARSDETVRLETSDDKLSRTVADEMSDVEANEDDARMVWLATLLDSSEEDSTIEVLTSVLETKEDWLSRVDDTTEELRTVLDARIEAETVSETREDEDTNEELTTEVGRTTDDDMISVLDASIEDTTLVWLGSDEVSTIEELTTELEAKSD